MKLAQIDAQAKTVPECGSKEAEKAKNTCYLQKTRNGVFHLKGYNKNSLKYVTALKTKCEEGPVLLSDYL